MEVTRQRDVAPIKIAVADGNLMACGLVSAGLKRYTRFDVIGYATSTADLLNLIATHAPQVILIGCDLEDGHFTGLSVLPEIQTKYPELNIVLLIDRSDPELVVQAFRGGAKGVFDRSESHFQHLCKCVDCVYQGQIWANTQQLKFLLHALAQAPSPRVINAEGANLLTRREEDLLRLVVDGLGNREIARRLNLSEHTIKNYMFRIFDKLGISNRVELVLYALNNSRRVLTSFPVNEARVTEAGSTPNAD